MLIGSYAVFKHNSWRGARKVNNQDNNHSAAQSKIRLPMRAGRT